MMKSTAGLGGPTDLLLEGAPDQAVRFRVLGLVDVGVGNVTGKQAAAFGGYLLGDRQCLTVERLEDLLLADDLQLLAVAVVGERLDHVRAGVDEIPVQLAHHLGMVEHHLGHVGPGLQVAAPLELEQIALGADHRTGLEPLQQPPAGRRPLLVHHRCSSRAARRRH